MANHTSDTETLNFNEWPVEEFKDSIHPETITSQAQKNKTKETQTEEVSKKQVLLNQQHNNQRETHEDLYTNRNLIHTIITLLHNISANLKKKQ